MRPKRTLFETWLVCVLVLQAGATQAATSVTKIAAGDGHSLFLQSDGSLWGMGDNYSGGAHCSAGGQFVFSDSSVVADNTALSSGGGISVKSARTDLSGTVTVGGNMALGNAAAGWGNGGGVYATTAAYEGNGSVATLYQDEGTIVGPSTGVLIRNNLASRWGGRGLCRNTLFGE